MPSSTVSGKLYRYRLLFRVRCIISWELLGACLRRIQINYDCSDVYPIAGIDSLLPASSMLRCHIQRGAFLIFRACKMLVKAAEHEATLKLMGYGWNDYFGTLLLSKCLKYPCLRLSSQRASMQASVPHDFVVSIGWCSMHHFMPWKDS